MSAAPYRLYLLGPSGMIASGVDIVAADHEAAISLAQARDTGRGMELWAPDGKLVREFPKREQDRV